MGGKNHQPCRIYLVESTKLSRFLSLAYAELELGNVALEDLILAELDGQFGSIVPMYEHLNSSAQALRKAHEMVAILREKMFDNEFADLPSLRKLNLWQVGAALMDKSMVEYDSWKTVTRVMKKGGFYEVLLHLERSIETLSEKTSSLITSVRGLQEVTEKGEANLVLEENRPGNIKEAFAALYTAWTKFNQDFLASSLLSTELWYAFNGYGSLAGRSAQLMAV